MKITPVLLIACSLPALAQYSVERDGEVVRLKDSSSQTTVSILTSMGNLAFEMTVKGANILRFPYASLDEFKKRPSLSGIPLLAPWGNRLDEQAFYANGHKYTFNMELGNVKGAIPIHGFLTYSEDWKVVEAKADKQSAWITSRLEVWRQPSSMAQWPFAHNIEITYRLQRGVLEVKTRIENLSADPMPVAIGFHPYFQLTDSARDEWIISVGARSEWLLSPNRMPSGETRPIEQMFPNPQAAALKDYSLDNVFGDLIRDAAGRAIMTVKGKSQRLDVEMGPNYHAAVIFSPNPNGRGGQGGRGGAAPAAGADAGGRGPGGAPGAAAPGGAARGPAGPGGNNNYICFEPMSGITDALNLAQKGLYKDLQSIPPGGSWQESFWVRPSGF